MFRFVSQLILAVALVGFSADLAHAQFGGDSRTRGFFSFIDKNKNGVIESSEFDQMPGRLKESLESAGVDTRRSMSQQEFENVMPKLMERMRSQRGSSGGDDRRRSGFSRGSGGFGGPPRGSFSRPDDRGDRDDRDSRDSRGGFDPRSSRGRYGSFDSDRGPGSPDDGRRDSGRSSSSNRSSSRSGNQEPSKSARTTVDLNQEYVPHDADQDGQVGLYEWRKSNPGKLSEFFTMDLNGDGFLTPREIALSKAGKTQRSAASFMYALGTGQQTPASPASPAPQSEVKPQAPQPVASSQVSAPAAESKPPTPSTDPVVNQANYFFKLLDRDKDGSVSAEEWKKSRSMRRLFEQENIDLTVTMSQDQFVKHYVAFKKD